MKSRRRIGPRPPAVNHYTVEPSSDQAVECPLWVAGGSRRPQSEYLLHPRTRNLLAAG